MLSSMHRLLSYSLMADDANLGSLKDVYFDDKSWMVRYLVADTGGWLPGRQVLIAPHSVAEPDDLNNTLPVMLTRRQVEQSPPVETDMPVGRREEAEMAKYYGWPEYWVAGPSMALSSPPPLQPDKHASAKSEGDPHLRSFHEVTGYHVHATDGDIGHIEDVLVDTEAWIIRHVVVDTRNWIGGRKVVVSTRWFTRVDWPTHEVHTDLDRQTIKNSPEFNATGPVDRAFEEKLFRSVGRRGYWQPGKDKRHG